MDTSGVNSAGYVKPVPPSRIWLPDRLSANPTVEGNNGNMELTARGDGNDKKGFHSMDSYKSDLGSEVGGKRLVHNNYGTYSCRAETQRLRDPEDAMAKEVNIVFRVAIDFLCILIVGLPILILHLIGKPYERGVNCDDESIRYPFRDSTVTNTTLYCVGLLVPTFAIILTETIRYLRRSGLEPPVRRVFLHWNVHPLLWEIYIKVGIFGFGACLSQMTTDIAKYTIGRLRPHFWDVCQPDITCEPDDHTYVTDFVCKSGKTALIREARLSFMSGHSSFSAFTMLYLALYMQSRVRFRGFKLLRPFLQALVLYAAWFTALSRISDYKHHWSDVLAGSIQGTLVALLVVFFISDLFPKKKGQSTSETYFRPTSDFSAYRPNEHHKPETEQCS